MHCTNCGREIPNQSKFCQYCGKPVEPLPAQPVKAADSGQPSPTPPAPKKRKKWPWVLLAIILIVCAAGVVAWYYVLPYLEADRHGGFEAYYEPFSDEDVVLDAEIPYVDSQLLLTAGPDASFQDVKSLIQQYGGEIVGYISISNDYQIAFRESKDYDQLISIAGELESSELVDMAMPHYVAELDVDSVDYKNDPWTDSDNPNDTSGSEWTSLPDGNNWWAVAIGMPEVWASDTQFSEVKVGIIDSMFDTDQTDLKDVFVKVWNNPNDVVQQYERIRKKFIKDESDKKYYHGTHVAGIIAAEAANDFGITGVSQNARLYGYAMDGNTEGNTAISAWRSIFEYKYAISLMLNEGVRVINISMSYEEMLLGASKGNRGDLICLKNYSETMADFLRTCLDAGYDFLIVKSAGNNDGCDAKFDVWGAIEDETVKSHIIIVGAANNQTYYYNIASFSNIGDRVDIYAPGVGVLSDMPGNRTGLLSGTSMAAPIVTGAAALMLGVDPGLTGEQLAAIIKRSHTPVIPEAVIKEAAVSGKLSLEEALKSEIYPPVTILYVPSALALTPDQDPRGTDLNGGHDRGILMGVVYYTYNDKVHDLFNITVDVLSDDGKNVCSVKAMGAGGYNVVLPAGQYQIKASALGFKTSSAAVTVNAGETVQQNIELRPVGGAASVDVQDAYCYVGTADTGIGIMGDERIENEGTQVEYRFPKVVIDGVSTDEVNAALWSGDESELSWTTDAQGRKYDSLYDLMTYDWYVTGDTLSILSIDRYTWGTVSYAVKNISVTTGQFMTDDAVLAQAGLTWEAFYALAEDTLHKNYATFLSQYCGGMDEETAFSNIHSVEEATPFFNSLGHLSMVAFGAPVTADLPYLFLFDLETQELFEVPGYEMVTRGDVQDEPNAPAEEARAEEAPAEEVTVEETPAEEVTAEEAPAEEARAEEAPAEEIPADETAVEVRDAFSYSDTYHDPYDSQFDKPVEYHVPEIMCSGVSLDVVNEQLWNELYDETIEAYGDMGSSEFFTGILYMKYNWYLNDDILSLLIVESWGPEDPSYSYRVYNISIPDGEFLSTDAFFDRAGASSEEYRTTLKGLLAGHVNAYYDMSQYLDETSRTRALSETLSGRHLDLSCPFLNYKGELCALAYLYYCYAPAEAYGFLFNLETGKIYGEMAQEVNADALEIVIPPAEDLPADDPGASDDRWEVFNDMYTDGSYLYSQILLNPGTHEYIATVNLLEAYGTVIGNYTEGAYGEVCCEIETKDFWGYGDDDATEFWLQRQDDKLTPVQDIWCMSSYYGVEFEYARDFTVTPDEGTGTVTGDSASFFSGPSTEDIILFELNSGDAVTILGAVDDWLMVEYASEGMAAAGLKVIGFISSEYIAR